MLDPVSGDGQESGQVVQDVPRTKVEDQSGAGTTNAVHELAASSPFAST